MNQNKPKGILAFDLDGTLVCRNQQKVSPSNLVTILNQISKLGYFSIPVTGKPVNYVKDLFPINNLIDNGIVAENAGVYRLPNSTEVHVFGPGIDKMQLFRDYLKIGFTKKNKTKITLDKTEYEVAVDPDDVSILTIFTDPKPVSHRWNFQKTIEADMLVEKLRKLIDELKISHSLCVLPAFPDGGVQVIRKYEESGKPIDKSGMVEVVAKIHNLIHPFPIAMFGDGHNDIPAMSGDNVVPVTFNNAHQLTKELVSQKGGYITTLNAPEEGGVIEGIKWLTSINFFKEDNDKVSAIISNNYA